MISVQISNDLKASVQRNNLALDLLLQNPEFVNDLLTSVKGTSYWLVTRSASRQPRPQIPPALLGLHFLGEAVCVRRDILLPPYNPWKVQEGAELLPAGSMSSGV